MNKKRVEKQKVRIDALCEKWNAPLFLGMWDLRFVYFDNLKSSYEPDDNFECFLKINSGWEYLDATVSVSVSSIEKSSDDELEELFLHEMVHLYTNEVWDVVEDCKGLPKDAYKHNERLTTMMAKIILNTQKLTEERTRKEINDNSIDTSST